MGKIKKQVKTHFASPQRAEVKELAAEIAYVNSYPVMTGLLDSIGGLLAILNEHRQLIALNDPLLKALGVIDPQKALGLRPGEALHCVYAEEGPGGCGTSKLCSSCGAAIAIVASLKDDAQVERICALQAVRDGKQVDIVLNVKSCPLRIEGKRFILLFLQDITQFQQKAALEKTFFHDISNMLGMLDWSSELLVQKEPSRLAEIIKQVSARLLGEVEMQRCLSAEENCEYQLQYEETSVQQILSELSDIFEIHPAADDMQLSFANRDNVRLQTDVPIVLRVLMNMLLNACEATDKNGEVKIWAEVKSGQVVFCIWNEQAIPDRIKGRVFQRNFSSKGGAGRGLGTYSMKFFGEKILGGEVDFESTAEEGTIFRFAVPL